MNWLNPTILSFLAAVGIPLLLYLLSRRKLPKIFFSSLRFLKELEKKQNRRIKITQWLLILLRMLAILSIVLAFARPLFTGVVPIGTNAGSDWVIVLDRSASMNARVGNTTVYDQCLLFLKTLLPSFDQDDKVQLIFADAVDSTFVFSNRVMILNGLEGSQPLPIPDDIGSGIRQAERYLHTSQLPFQGIILLTDGKGISDTTLHSQNDKIQYFLWTPELTELQNISIPSIHLKEPFLNVEAGINLSLQLQSYAKKEQSVSLKLSLKDASGSYQSIGEKTVELIGNSKFDVDWFAKLQGDGPWILRVEHLTEDALSQDNQIELYLPLLQSLNLSISGDVKERNQLSLLIEVNELLLSTQYQPKGIHIHSGQKPPVENASVWKSRIELGGHLWLIPSMNADVSIWNQWLSNFSNQRFYRFEFSERGVYTLKKRDLQMYLSEWVKDPIGMTNGRWKIEGGSTRLSFEDDVSVWSDELIGTGTLRIQSIPLVGTLWETEPLQLPLFIKGIQLLKNIESIPVKEAGTQIRLSPTFSFQKNWTSPTGKTIYSPNSVFTFDELGFWKSDSGDVLSIVYPTSENDLSNRTSLGGLNIESFKRLPTDHATAIQALQETRNGRELRSVLLAIALGLLLAEGIIGRGTRSKKNE